MSISTENYIEVDIATRIVADNEDFFVIRPGASYSLYDDFEREGAVFLDFPDLPISLDTRPKSSIILREIVTRSIAIRDGYRKKIEPAPSRDQASYTGKATGRRINAYIGAIQRLYYDLPIGTIILVPSKSLVGDVLFAEITGPTERRAAARDYPDEQMLVRPVRWLARKQKASVSDELLQLLGHPTPVMQLPRQVRDEILKVAFTQYVFHGVNSTRITTTKSDFSILDDLSIQLFNNYVAGLLAAEESDAALDVPIGITEAIRYLRDRRDLVPELDQSISSPGFQRLYNEHIAPLVIGVLMTAALSGQALAQTTEIRVINSAMLKNDPCAVQVEARVRGSMRLAHFGLFLEMCEGLKETKDNTGLKTSMHVSKKQEKKGGD